MEKEKLDQLIERVGSREGLVQLLQRRLRELAGGAQPLVESPAKDLVEVALQEAFEGKINLVPPPPAAPAPERIPFGRPPEGYSRDGGPVRRPYESRPYEGRPNDRRPPYRGGGGSRDRGGTRYGGGGPRRYR